MNSYCEVYKDTRGEYRWRFVAGNGRRIADSGEGYFNKSDCLAGITIIKTDAPAASVRDLTQSTGT